MQENGDPSGVCENLKTALMSQVVVIEGGLAESWNLMTTPRISTASTTTPTIELVDLDTLV